MRILGLNLKIKVDRLKFIILLGGLSLFLVIVTGVGYKVTTTPSFCVLCHSMQPEYVTWQASSHSEITCADCHNEPGVENMVKQKIGGLKNLYAQATGEFYLPIRKPIPISSEVCLKCHTLDRESTPSGDLIVPHKTHFDKKVSCVRCHSGVAHGNIATRRVTITSALSSWDEIKGKEQMQVQNTRTPMDDCMKCHQRREGPLECSACHKTSKKPLTHNDPSFKTKHGKRALVELDTCSICHGYAGYVGGDDGNKLNVTKSNIKGLISQKLLLPSKDRPPSEVVQYSRNNQFCVNCHSKKPENHKASDFSNTHAQLANANSDRCFTCHSNRPEEKNPVTRTTCVSCHPSTHAERDWKTAHPIKVEGKIENKCVTCHSQKTCGSCHINVRLKSKK